MYNKNKFQKVNDKKVLHKVRKHWITISVALLGIIGGSAIASHTTNVNADTTNSTNQSTNIKNNLNNDANNKLITTNSSSTNTNGRTNGNEQKINQQASQLHNNILKHTINQQNDNKLFINDKNSISAVSNSGDNSSFGKTSQRSNLTNYSLSTSSYLLNESNNSSAINNNDITNNKEYVTSEMNLENNVNNDKTSFNSSEINSALDSRMASDIHRISTYQSGIISDFYKPRVQADYTVASEIDKDNKSINSMKSSISSGMSNPTSAEATGANSDIIRADNLLKNANEIVPDANHYMDAYSSNWNDINDWQPEKKYYGLTYRYAPYEHALEFVSGTLNSDASNFSNNSNINKDIKDAKSIKFDSDINTIHTNNMSNMFQSDKNIESINLGSSFNTSNVTNMNSMFQSDKSLKILTLPESFNTHKVATMQDMFQSDINLDGLSLPSTFDTRNSSKPTSGPDGLSCLFTNAFAKGAPLIINSPYTFTSDQPDSGGTNTNAYFKPIVPKNELFADNYHSNVNKPIKDGYAIGLYTADKKPRTGTWYLQPVSDVGELPLNVRRQVQKSIGTVHYIDTTNGNQIKFAKISDIYGAPNFSNKIQSMFNNLPSGFELDNNYHHKTNIEELNNLPRNYPDTEITNYNIYVKPIQIKSNNVTDNINYHDIYSDVDGLNNPKSTTITGQANSNYLIKSPQGWAIVNNQGQTIDNPSFKYSAGNQIVNVAPVYDGLTYKYDKNNKSIEFTGGKLTWDGKANTDYNKQLSQYYSYHYKNSFIGCQDNAPSYIHNVQSIKFDNGVNVSNVSDMNGMFASDYNSNKSNLQSIDLGNNFDTSNVNDMSGMFLGCTKLHSLILGSKFDTSNVKNMSYMFANDWNLQSLNLDFNTDKVTNMCDMFNNDHILQSLNMSGFNNKNVTYMNSTFKDDSQLQSLNLGYNFGTNNVTDMSQMFNNDNSLRHLTLPGTFNTSKVTNMQGMFGKNSDSSTNNTLQSLTIQSPNTKFNNSVGLNSQWHQITNSDDINSIKYPVVIANLMDSNPHMGIWTPGNPEVTDRINFNGDSNANITEKGMRGTQSSVNAPQGYHYINNSNGQFTFDNGTHTFDVAPNIYTHTDNIEYQDNGVTKATQDFTGNVGNSFDVNSSNANIPAGYELVNPNNQFNYNDSHDVVPITPKQGTDNIIFIIKGTNNQIGTGTASGNLNSSYTVQSSQVPNNNYHLANDGTQTFNIINGQNHNVDVLPNTVIDRINFDGDSDANTTKQGIVNTNSSVSAPNNYHYINNSNGQFTFDGGTHTFDVARNQHTDNVQYQVNGTTKTTQNFTGNTNSDFDVTSSNANIPEGYKLVNPDSRFSYNDNTDVVPITPKQDTDTINFINKKTGQKVGSTQVTNNDGSSDTVSSDQVPDGYHLANDGTQTFTVTPNGEHDVNVLPNTVPTTPKPKSTPQPQKQQQKPQPQPQEPKSTPQPVKSTPKKEVTRTSKPSEPKLPQTNEQYSHKTLGEVMALLSLSTMLGDFIEKRRRRDNK